MLKAIGVAANALFHSVNFFDALSGTRSIREAFIFYCKLFVIIPLSIILLIAGGTAIFTGEKNFLVLLILLLSCAVYAVVTMLGTFVITAVMHLFVILFRGKGGYSGTFNVFIYSSGAAFFYQIIASLVLLSVVLLRSWVSLLPMTIIILIGLLWLIAIPVIGYRVMHNMGTIRAIGALAFPMILFISASLLINHTELTEIKNRISAIKINKSGLAAISQRITAAPSPVKLYEEKIKTGTSVKKMRLGGIVLSAKGYRAMINDNFVGAGDVVEGLKVIAVTKNEVKLADQNGKEVVLRP